MTLIKRIVCFIQKICSRLPGQSAGIPSGAHDRLESYLLTLFKKTLQVENLSVTDDFFEKGGTSLATHEIMSSLSKALGEDVPITTFVNASCVLALTNAVKANHPKATRVAFDVSTDADSVPHQAALLYKNLIGSELFPDDLYEQHRKLAVNWSGEVKSKSGFIVGRNVKGSKAPILCCCQGELEFNSLADKVGPDQPVFGMRSGVHVFESRERSDLVKALSGFYWHEIQTIVPKGPVIVTGNCQAALISIAIADLACMAGYDVSLLLLNYIISAPRKYIVHSFLGKQEARDWFGFEGDTEPGWVKNLTLFSYEYVTGSHGNYFFSESDYLEKFNSYLEGLAL